jgi:pumilio RNA-binding family
MRDVFGNYVIQKILEKGSADQKDKLIQIIMRDVLRLSLNTYGCRVVQKALEEASKMGETLLMAMINPLRHHVLQMIRDPNGNHVIQKCFDCADFAELEFIINDVEAHVSSPEIHRFSNNRLIRWSLTLEVAVFYRRFLSTLIRNLQEYEMMSSP